MHFHSPFVGAVHSTVGKSKNSRANRLRGCRARVSSLVGADYSSVLVRKHAGIRGGVPPSRSRLRTSRCAIRSTAAAWSERVTRQAGQRRGAGVIAMTEGRLLTVIALSTWFVAVRIGMTVPVLPGPETAIT
jgi:hypothetical protein